MKYAVQHDIKHMVCSRCKMAVENELEKEGIEPVHVDLGEIELKERPDTEQLDQLNKAFAILGFEIIDDKKSQLIANIKSIIISLVQGSEIPANMNLSAIIAKELPYDYRY